MGFAVAAAVLATGAVWMLRLVLNPGEMAGDSATLLGLDLLLLSAVVSTGLVLSRGRWARNAAYLLIGAQLALTAVLGLDAWGWATLLASVAALALVAGPWLDGFLRRLPPADAAPTVATILAVGGLALPGLIAVANPGGLSPVHWAAAGIGLAATWMYSRAVAGGLWLMRLLVPAAMLVAAVVGNLAGGIVLSLAAAGVALLAWHRSAALAVDPLVPSTATGAAVPPELVPPDLLRAAGYDERGRPLEDRNG